jgi:hypothetical protein
MVISSHFVYVFFSGKQFFVRKNFSYFYDMLKIVSTCNTYSYMRVYGMSWLQIKARILFAYENIKFVKTVNTYTCTYTRT